MNQHEQNEDQQSLLDLNEVMRAFDVDTWSVLELPEDERSSELFQLLVESEGQRYLLRERPEGLIAQESGHHYAFQRYLRDQGIPVASLRETLQGEPYTVIGEDAFELQEWIEGERFVTADAREQQRISAAGEMRGRSHQASLH